MEVGHAACPFVVQMEGQHATHCQRELSEEFSVFIDAFLFDGLLDVLQKMTFKLLVDLHFVGESTNEVLLFTFGQSA